jgi:hypothetical protein
MDYSEAIERLQKSGQTSHSGEWGLDLQTEHDRYINRADVCGRLHPELSKGYQGLLQETNNACVPWQPWTYWSQVEINGEAASARALDR